jgi:hypothetical protein
MGVPGLADTLADQPWVGVPLLGVVALGVWLTTVAMTALPPRPRAVAPFGIHRGSS